MLDDVERRGFLVQPARKDPLEDILRIAHIDLHECAGQRLRFPGRRRFAGTQADDHVADPERLARLHRQVARNAVALVQQPDDGDAFGHRRSSRRDRGDGLGNIDGDRLGFRIALHGGRRRRAAAARDEQQAYE